MIAYCPTLDILSDLADDLGCPIYTGGHGTMSGEEKEEALRQWLRPTGSPAIVATSALGIGFDYPHVRWVIHAGAPRRMTEFSQESGRAGRDGKQAESIVVLSAAWRPPVSSDMDQESMNLYLTQQHCLRAVMSQFLDKAQDWRWCMKGEDELCGICPQHHVERRPSGVEVGFASSRGTQAHKASGINPAGKDAKEGVMDYTGPDEVLRQTRINSERLGRFESNLRLCVGVAFCAASKAVNHSIIALDHVLGVGLGSRRRQTLYARARPMEGCGWLDILHALRAIFPRQSAAGRIQR